MSLLTQMNPFRALGDYIVDFENSFKENETTIRIALSTLSPDPMHVRMLLTKSCLEDRESIVDIILQNKYWSKVVVNLTDSFGQVLLHRLPKNDKKFLKYYEKLCNAGAKIGIQDIRGFTPLAYAAAVGDLDAIMVLLNHADRINKKIMGDFLNQFLSKDTAGLVVQYYRNTIDITKINEGSEQTLPLKCAMDHFYGCSIRSEEEGQYARQIFQVLLDNGAEPSLVWKIGVLTNRLNVSKEYAKSSKEGSRTHFKDTTEVQIHEMLIARMAHPSGQDSSA